jgi:hypothetical protein
MKAGETCGACSRCWRNKKCTQILVGKLEGKNHLKDPDVNGRIILEGILER